MARSIKDVFFFKMNCYYCLIDKTEEKKDETKSLEDSFHTGEKSTLAVGTEYQNCAIFHLHSELTFLAVRDLK